MECENFRVPFIVLLLLGLLGFGCREADAQQPQQPAAPVIVAEAKQQSFATTITATAVEPGRVKKPLPLVT